MTLRIAALLFFLACAAYGALEVHGSTDTWLGMALGREILSADSFPVADSFSYTRHGEPSLNQNWLTHAAQYWLYDRVGPNAVILLTWFLAASVSVMTFLACRWRTRSVAGAFLVAGLVGFACRDFLSPRPATTGIFCIATLWALISALESQDRNRRWWPIAWMLPVLLVWSHAHGSFVFGFGTLGLYLAWSLLRRFRKRAVLDWGQWTAIAVVLVGALAFGAMLSPFGAENLVHGLKVVDSDIFREASEWRPPFSSGGFPPVLRFWTVSALALAGCLTAWWLGRSSMKSAKEPIEPPNLLDLAMIGLTLYMTLWARRFAPLFLIHAAPATLAFIAARVVVVPRRLRAIVTVAVLLAAIGVGFVTIRQARMDLVDRRTDDSASTLLHRVTRYDKTPGDAVRYLERNEIDSRLFVELAQAGQVMFHAPRTRVYIDGRAQQVYFDEDKLRYKQILLGTVPPPQVLRLLDESDTNTVLLRPRSRTQGLYDTLQASMQWSPVLLGDDHTLFMRNGSPPLVELGQRLRRNREWRPDTARAVASRGLLWILTSPPDLEQAVESWREAVRRDITTGSVCFKPLTRGLVALGRPELARRLVVEWGRSLKPSESDLDEASRKNLLGLVDECSRMLDGTN